MTAALLLAGGLTGSVLLLVSQFLTLYNTHVAAQRAPVASGSVGGAHGYALVPIAVLAAFLTAGVYAALSRPSLLALGILGAVALVISLARDLPAAHREGVRLAAGHYVQAANTPAAGMYVETAGAVVLLITCVCGFILLGAPQPRPRSSGSPRPGGAPSRP